MASETPASKKKIFYPYRVDYNDHFETPLNAYTDILPMLDAVAPSPCSNDNDNDIELSPKKKKRRRSKQRNAQNRGDVNSPCSAGTNTSSSGFHSTSTRDVSSHDCENSSGSTSTGSTSSSSRSSHVIYDPYFCNGKTKLLLQSIGFKNVQHEKRDFYKDIQQKSIPNYDTLITNPPYSEDHKEKCMQFAINQLRPRSRPKPKPKQTGKINKSGGKDKDKDKDTVDAKSSSNDQRGKPFFILMPNYCACRNHFRSAILHNAYASSKHKNGIGDNNSEPEPLDIMYVVPSKPYEYDHPEGTGKDTAPFASIWYCGIPLDKVDAVKEAFRRVHGTKSVGVGVGLPVVNSSSSTCSGRGKKRHRQRRGKAGSGSGSLLMPPRLVSSLAELKRLNAVPTVKRPNPKQRKKARMARAKGLMFKPDTAFQSNLHICEQNLQKVGSKTKNQQKKEWKRKRK